uniref:uncharacterized protein LOC124060811 isoform X3 n=1 Tax=Scatophagus argus TaxID=75038 RepID=UPI001ED847C2|nr:uncharacterized protein LOC124060811 isoform X3 [Scatophagus argus]
MTENNMESAEKGAGCVRLKKHLSAFRPKPPFAGRGRSSLAIANKHQSALQPSQIVLIKDVIGHHQADTISAGRESFLKGLCVYLNEDPQKLVKEDLDVDSIRMALAETPIGVFVVGHEGAELGDVGIALEGVEVMGNQRAKSFSARVGFYYYYYY